ncbi:MAG: hypothetical protein RR651_05525, partial [Lysinibacillus sp.]
VLAAAIGYNIKTNKETSTTTPAEVKEEIEVDLLNNTGRKEIRELLKKARNKTYVDAKGKTANVIDPAVHTDAKIDAYTDEQLLSYQAAVINRTF